MSLPLSIHEGGPVFAATLAIGIVALAVFVERLIVLHRARIRFSDFLTGVFNILSKGKVREALAICDETAGPVARLAHSAIMHRGDNPEDLRAALDDAGKVEVARLERRLRIISAIMHVAPLMGLLGGALGGLRVVRTLQSSGQLVQTLDLTNGLATALLCAAAGLAVTILSFILSAIATARIDQIILDMEQAAADLLAFMPTVATVPDPTTAQGEAKVK